MTRTRALHTLADALLMLAFLVVTFLFAFALLAIACGGTPCSLE